MSIRDLNMILKMSESNFEQLRFFENLEISKIFSNILTFGIEILSLLKNMVSIFKIALLTPNPKHLFITLLYSQNVKSLLFNFIDLK